jgi:hypothetical protein
VPDTGFLPSRDGLAFTNDWPSEPAIQVDVPLVGKVPIGNASNGLCGGMVFTALDIFTAGGAPPSEPRPAHGTPRFKYIVRRLIDSWDVPEGVLKYFHWMNTPDHDVDVWIATHHGVAWRTVSDEWPKVRAELDAGRPCPLGLVTVHASNPVDLGKNHQVLAWGYEIDGARVTIKVYDPNTERSGGDGVHLAMAVDDPATTAGITHDVNIGHPVRGFFRVAYTRSDPPR